VSQKQMDLATEQLHGHYGLFVVFLLKHIQAEYTVRVETDILFFNAFFYSIIGAAGIPCK